MHPYDDMDDDEKVITKLIKVMLTNTMLLISLHTYSVMGKLSLSPSVPVRETVRVGSILSVWLMN